MQRHLATAVVGVCGVEAHSSPQSMDTLWVFDATTHDLEDCLKTLLGHTDDQLASRCSISMCPSTCLSNVLQHLNTWGAGAGT